MNRTLHKDTIHNIYVLNYNHTEVYKYIYGDKETFWIGCCLANKPFTMSKEMPDAINKLTQYYKGEILYKQK